MRVRAFQADAACQSCDSFQLKLIIHCVICCPSWMSGRLGVCLRSGSVVTVMWFVFEAIVWVLACSCLLSCQCVICLITFPCICVQIWWSFMNILFGCAAFPQFANFNFTMTVCHTRACHKYDHFLTQISEHIQNGKSYVITDISKYFQPSILCKLDLQ